MPDLPVDADRGEPLSPCINICSIEEHSGLCRGCYRTLDEIAGWARLAVAEKRAVLQQLGTRRDG